jgi:quinolinate synthetase A subunit
MHTSTISFDAFNQLKDAAAHERIRAARARLGKKAVLLCHHYQRADVYQYADLTGDSLKLVPAGLANRFAEFIVFCGVHFMAEVADIMSSQPDRDPPDLAAGCSMADMANLAKVERCWRELPRCWTCRRAGHAGHLHQLGGRPEGLLRRPHGGIVCTSSNAGTIADWAFARREKVLFFPDQHLGRWTGHKMGIPLDEMVVWDPTSSSAASARADPQGEDPAVEGALLGAPDVPAGAHRPLARAAPAGLRDLAPGVQFRGVPEVRLRRLDRAHRQGPSRKRRPTRTGWSAPNSTW